MKQSIIVFLFLVLIVLQSCEKESAANSIPTEQPPAPPVPEVNQIDSNASLTEGLIAYYPFNGTAKDASENQYDLLPNGTVTTDNRFGESGKAYLFNGSSDYMVIPAINKADSLRNFTISAWVKTDKRTEQAFISFLGTGDMRCNSYMALDFSGSQPRVRHSMLYEFTTSSCSNALIADTITDPFGKWSHVVIVQQYIPDNNSSYYLYHTFFNGKPGIKGSSRLWGSPVAVDFGQGGLIGATNTTTDYQWNYRIFSGALDDIRIYNRTLTDDEIQKLYRIRE